MCQGLIDARSLKSRKYSALYGCAGGAVHYKQHPESNDFAMTERYTGAAPQAGLHPSVTFLNQRKSNENPEK